MVATSHLVQLSIDRLVRQIKAQDADGVALDKWLAKLPEDYEGILPWPQYMIDARWVYKDAEKEAKRVEQELEDLKSKNPSAIDEARMTVRFGWRKHYVAKTRMDFMKKYEDVFVDIPAVKRHIKTAKDRLQDADDAANKAQLELDSMTILLSLNGHS